MSVSAPVLFLVSAFVGSYFQAVTGFAMGMIIIAIVGVSGAADIPTITAAVGLLAMVNVAVSLRGRWRSLHRRLLLWLSLGQISAIWGGLWLLLYLDANARTMLQLVLGLFITLGALSMLIRPTPSGSVSGSAAAYATGVVGGVVGGLFAASGPVLGWFGYRQPLELDAIRATLLCCFAVTTSTRTVLVGVEGGLTADVWTLAAAGLPVVLLGTWLGRVAPPPISDMRTKQLAVALLLGAGVGLLAGAL